MAETGDAVDAPVCLVTGAGSGIGAAVARRLVASGWRVTGVDLHFTDVWDGGRSMIQVVGDVSDPETCNRAVAQSGRELQLLINAAAVRPTGAAVDADSEEWRRCLDVNLIGVAAMVRAAAPVLADGRASILNVASAAAYGKQRLAVYGASKAGLVSLSRTLATELASRGIRVNVIVPGTTDTGMLTAARATATGAPAVSSPRNFGGAVLDPDAVARDLLGVVALLHVTGAVIPVGLLPWEW